MNPGRGSQLLVAAVVTLCATVWMATGRPLSRRTALAAGAVTLGNVTSTPPTSGLAALTPRLAWERLLPGVTFRESSPVSARFARPAVVVGALNGRVYAFDQASGADVAGWPVPLGHPINSSPSAADLTGTGQDSIAIGSGTADGGPCGGGGVSVIDASGHVRWTRAGVDRTCGSLAFHSSPVIGDITGSGVPSIADGALGLQSWAWTPAGDLLPGWPYYTDDTVFATSALVDLTGGAVPELVMGGDSSPGGTIDERGGLVRGVTGDGRTLWQFFTDEIVRSSPAVGDGQIVFGTGDYWVNQPGGAHDSDKVFALDLNGRLRWSRDLGAETIGGPALADVAGDGSLDTVIGTADGARRGLVWVLGPDGRPLPQWAGVDSGGGVVIGGISTADFNGDGRQDLLVPTGSGVFAFDGRTGRRLFSLDAQRVGFQSTPLITQEPNGALGITVAGTTAYGEGVVQHWVLPPGGQLGGRGWPTFHHDARRTGNASPPPLTNASCAGVGINGYWEAAADGGVFGWCGAGFHGRAATPAPIVAIASTPTGRGYWEAAADGGVYAFGDAPFVGSAAGVSHAPIVALARTPDGRGYWLTAADGGVFAFGSARFYGGAGGVHLPFSVITMMATPDGGGYWLVGNEGSVLSYGDAPFFGSPVNVSLTAPIVGGAPTPSGLGYWLVAADGGVFTYGDAVYAGSTGGLHLKAPIVGMAATAAGRGYWLVASDGGVFAFGDARFVGSTASLALRQPVVALVPRGG